jgi:hypothetical protein
MKNRGSLQLMLYHMSTVIIYKLQPCRGEYREGESHILRNKWLPAMKLREPF